MFYIIGIGINLFLILLLVSKKDKTLADRFLLVWLSTICLHLTLYVVSITLPEENYVSLFGVAPMLPLLHGPLLYLYTAAMTNMLPIKKGIWALHFIPAILIFVLMIPFFLLPFQAKMSVINSKGKGFEVQSEFIKYLVLGSGVTYVTWILILLRRHKQNIKNQFSSDEKIKLDWLRYLVLGLGVVWVIVLLQAIIEKTLDEYIFGVVVLNVVVIGYFGIRQGRIYEVVGNSDDNYLPDIQNTSGDHAIEKIFQKSGKGSIEDVVEVENVLLTDIPHKKKYAKSGLTEEAAAQLYTQLRDLMDREKIFTEPELTLVMLAAKLSVHPNYLSQVINEKENKSFYDYVNTLRVEEFKRIVKLPGNEKFTIMSLAYDCGFNSKSSFNKNFKKVTGLSPSEFLKK